MFGKTTKINGIPNAVDQGMHNLYSHIKIQTFEVSDDDVTHDTRAPLSTKVNSCFWSWK